MIEKDPLISEKISPPEGITPNRLAQFVLEIKSLFPTITVVSILILIYSVVPIASAQEFVPVSATLTPTTTALAVSEVNTVCNDRYHAPYCVFLSAVAKMIQVIPDPTATPTNTPTPRPTPRPTATPTATATVAPGENYVYFDAGDSTVQRPCPFNCKDIYFNDAPTGCSNPSGYDAAQSTLDGTPFPGFPFTVLDGVTFQTDTFIGHASVTASGQVHQPSDLVVAFTCTK